ncbi:hypothetical protein KSX_37150 [Ktedonospora formicarum]|uniref:Uncharacterized protein n=1 Tax=Ktedonospora formicarum TaxID=2778364 RepID=A0A8J3MR48_9CHLR|nr:hypothetical protein KSX_37150 [Ktedonospora formicarum]
MLLSFDGTGTCHHDDIPATNSDLTASYTGRFYFYNGVRGMEFAAGELIWL